MLRLRQVSTYPATAAPATEQTVSLRNSLREWRQRQSGTTRMARIIGPPAMLVAPESTSIAAAQKLFHLRLPVGRRYRARPAMP